MVGTEPLYYIPTKFVRIDDALSDYAISLSWASALLFCPYA